MKNAIILTSESSLQIARTIQNELGKTVIFTKADIEGTIQISSISGCISDIFDEVKSILFIGAMGICVRSIAPYIKDKHTDPAIVNIDSIGKYVISVLSGHVGGANDLTQRIAHILGAEAILCLLYTSPSPRDCS